MKVYYPLNSFLMFYGQIYRQLHIEISLKQYHHRFFAYHLGKMYRLVYRISIYFFY